MDRLQSLREMASNISARKEKISGIGARSRSNIRGTTRSLLENTTQTDYQMAEWINTIMKAREEPIILEDEPAFTEPTPLPGATTAAPREAHVEGVSEAATLALRRLEDLAGGPLTITSGYRDPETNARVGGASGSQHLHGNAFDISVAGMSTEQRIALIRQAQQAGFTGIGVYDNSLHFDVGPARAWGPSYSRDSLPAWARGAING